MPNGSAELRYLYHEVIEEAQHSLMFQEFVNRTGLDVDGLPAFARAYLRRNVPKLGLVRRHLLRLRTPLILGNMARLMMQPPAQIVREYAIPKSALREAYRGNAVFARARCEALGKTRALCAELGLIRAPYTLVWRGFGILRS